MALKFLNQSAGIAMYDTIKLNLINTAKPKPVAEHPLIILKHCDMR